MSLSLLMVARETLRRLDKLLLTWMWMRILLELWPLRVVLELHIPELILLKLRLWWLLIMLRLGHMLG
jgi:hypothetical protein